MDFYCTSTFRKTFKEFTKKKNRALNSCKSDIVNALNSEGLDIDNCGWMFKEHDSPKFNFYKAKINNSSIQKGKRAGFRVYFAYDKHNDEITLMEMLHKSGKQGKEQLAPRELKNEIRLFLEEHQSQERYPLDLSEGEIKIIE